MALNHTLQCLLSFLLQDFILEHYSEDGYLYEDEIADLMDLRQVWFCTQQGGGWLLELVESSEYPIIAHFRSYRRANGWRGSGGIVESSIPLATEEDQARDLPLACLGLDSGTPEFTPALSFPPRVHDTSSRAQAPQM